MQNLTQLVTRRAKNLHIGERHEEMETSSGRGGYGF